MDLQPDVNVIVGINGSGKSALLDAISIALHDATINYSSRVQLKRAALKVTDLHIASGSSDTIVGRKNFAQIAAEAVDYYECLGFPAKTPSGEPKPIAWTELIEYQPPYGFVVKASASPVLNYYQALWQEVITTEGKALVPFPVIAYYRSSRRFQQMPDLGNIFGVSLDRESAFKSALNAGADYQAMCQWLYLRENSELREKVQLRHDFDFEFSDLRAVRQALSCMLTDVERLFFDGNSPKLKVILQSDIQPAPVLEIEQLSDGYRNLLAIALDFARRLALAHPNWHNPLEAPGILLIDEIELHLHPSWQQKVIPNLRAAFPNTQLIVTTHSPQILTTVRREQIHLLTDEHTIEKLPNDIGTYGAESSRILQEVFCVNVRPKSIETVEKLQKYLCMVESQSQDTEVGRTLRRELEDAIGNADTDLLMADMRINQLKILREKSTTHC
jgi:predicted ATP-binding protein involved in virulence